MKKLFSGVLVMALAIAAVLAYTCREDDDDDKKAWFPEPVDHAFANGTEVAGGSTQQPDPSGPVIDTVTLVPGNLVIQGQILTVTLKYTDLEGDVTSPNFIVHLRDRDEHWTFGPDEISGGVVANELAIKLEVSRYFEPEAYIMQMALMDDAGNIGNWYPVVLIVIPYLTPEIIDFVPEDGATYVPLNASVRALFSDPVVGDPPTLTLFQNGAPVPSSIHLLPNIKGITLMPDGFLAPDAEYSAVLNVGDIRTGVMREQVNTFTTMPMLAAPDLTGRVYAVVVESDSIIEPEGAEVIFTLIPFPPLLVKITTFNDAGEIIDSISALGDPGTLAQLPMIPVISFPGQTAVLKNPFFSMGPTTLTIDLYALLGPAFNFAVNIYDFSITGYYSLDGDWFMNGIVTGYIDAQEINDAFNEFSNPPIPFDACNFLPDACDLDGNIAFRAEGISGQYLDDRDLYDLIVAVDSDTISGAAGDSVTVTVEYQVSGVPEGAHDVTITASYGKLMSCGGASCVVTTANGVYNDILSVLPNETGGNDINITASVSSPVGNMTRSTKVIVE
jgi:hypothetical protein